MYIFVCDLWFLNYSFILKKANSLSFIIKIKLLYNNFKNVIKLYLDI